jgi:hypothetical protein
MTRLSSTMTFFYKRVFPVIWFGFLGIFMCIIGAEMIKKQNVEIIPLILGPLVMGIVGYLIVKWIILNLVDEVWDCGESVLIKNNGYEYRFALSDFMSVGYNGFINPPRVTLCLREPAEDLGTEIAFIPPFRILPYSTPPIVRDLMLRVDEARRHTP